MQERIITLATPVFFALIALELAWGLLRKRNTYRLNDAIGSLSLGICSQVWGVFMGLLRIGIYAAIFEHVALARWPEDAWWTIPAAFVFYDFCYYWHHRLMHRVAIAWAAHVVHHSSEDFNLSTALRQPGTGALLGWIPYVPMAIAGVPPTAFAIVALADLLYQFWIHTEHVRSLGWFDRVFASPSNHRVHHGVNDRYVDRNYGGVLIVWDRLFGTFEPERADERIVYGTRAPLRSFDPLRANFEVYAQLARDARACRRWRDRLQIWFRPPGWRPAELAARQPRPPFDLAAWQRYDPQVGRAEQRYALVQFAIQLVFAVHFLQAWSQVSMPEALLYMGWITLSLVGIGGVLEGRRGALAIELVRHAFALVLPAAGVWFGLHELPPAGRAVLIAAFAGSLAHAWWLAQLPADRRLPPSAA